MMHAQNHIKFKSMYVVPFESFPAHGSY